jgi:hypothetical protein
MKLFVNTRTDILSNQIFLKMLSRLLKILTSSLTLWYNHIQQSHLINHCIVFILLLLSSSLVHLPWKLIYLLKLAFLHTSWVNFLFNLLQTLKLILRWVHSLYTLTNSGTCPYISNGKGSKSAQYPVFRLTISELFDRTNPTNWLQNLKRLEFFEFHTFLSFNRMRTILQTCNHVKLLMLSFRFFASLFVFIWLGFPHSWCNLKFRLRMTWIMPFQKSILKVQ